MRRRGGMSQLFKGIMIGIVLILAIIGTMSLLEDNNYTKTTSETSTTQRTPVIEAPSISINPDKPTTPITEESINTQEQLADNKPVIALEKETKSIEKPVLEDEKTPEELVEEPEPIKYGMLKLSAINPENKDKLKANYVVYDRDDVKVAESSNADNTSFRLPAGKYKVVTTLTRPDIRSGKPSPVVQKSQYITVREFSIARQVFELEPPSSNGTLQVYAVSATDQNQAMRANFIIQKQNGETIATRNNVTSGLFKLKAGSYKVSLSSGSNSDYRTVVVEAGESAEAVFKLQEPTTQGRVLVRIFDTHSSKPLQADIIITDTDGAIIQEFKSVSKTELELSEGLYKIQVTGPNGKSNKVIKIVAGQDINEVFRFEKIKENTSTQDTNITNNATIIDVSNEETEKPKEVKVKDVKVEEIAVKDDKKLNARVRIVARNESDKQLLKSNIYIQTPTGKHLDKKIYVDSAVFNLAPGTYKITVRSKNKENLVKTIRVSANQNIREIFLLKNVIPKEVKAKPKPPKPVTKPNVIPNGFLSVAMLPTNSQPVAPGNLNSHFIVSTIAGKKIVELTGVPSAKFKLDTGEYVVTAIHNSIRGSQRITIRENQNTRIAFNSGKFRKTPKVNKNTKGVLRSRVIDESGRPLKANLTVINTQGQIIARAFDVSVGKFNLSPALHTISVNYRGLRGSEVVKIKAGETTVQTFTIALKSNAPSIRNTPPANKKRNIEKIISDKIKKELQKQF